MADEDYRNFYPEVRTAGSLRAALHVALENIGSSLTPAACDQWFPHTYARVEKSTRFVQIYLAAKERLFLAEFWAHGVALAAGNCSDLAETAQAIDAWTCSERLMTPDMHSRFPWIAPRAGAEAYESGSEVEWRWKCLLSDASHSEETRIAIEVASRTPELMVLFPYTSMFTLCFSRCTGYPFTRDIPCITPLGQGRYSVKHMDGATIASVAIEKAVALVVQNLPSGCGSAKRGVADRV